MGTPRRVHGACTIFNRFVYCSTGKLKTLFVHTNESNRFNQHIN